MVYPDYLAVLYAARATLTPDHTLRSVHRQAGRLEATLVNSFTDEVAVRVVDQVVVEQGTTPVLDVYEDMVPESSNLGETDLNALLEGRPQAIRTNRDGRYRLFRIGDALTHRNIHAAIYDARRLCMTL